MSDLDGDRVDVIVSVIEGELDWLAAKIVGELLSEGLLVTDSFATAVLEAVILLDADAVSSLEGDTDGVFEWLRERSVVGEADGVSDGEIDIVGNAVGVAETDAELEMVVLCDRDLVPVDSAESVLLPVAE